MYAITIDLSNEMLDKQTPLTSYYFAHELINRALEPYGFVQKGSLYIGNESVNAVVAVMAVNAMSRELDWLEQCVLEIKILRIEEVSDLSLALKQS